MDRSIILLIVLFTTIAWGAQPEAQPIAQPEAKTIAEPEAKPVADAVDGKQTVKLATVYQPEPIFGARRIELRGTISPLDEGAVEISLDRNTCTLRPDGSTGECTMIAPQVLTGTLKPVTDPAVVAAIPKTSAVWDIITPSSMFHARLAKVGDAYRLIVLDDQSNPARVITLEILAK